MDASAHERLRNGGIDRLVDLLVDDVLDRPITELVDPSWLAGQLAETTRSAAADPQVERWFRDRVTELRSRVPAGPLPSPAEIVAPLQALLSRPYVPDRALVGALLDHDTARLMLKNLFQDLLISFARKLRPSGPVVPRTGLPFKGLQRMSESVLGVVGQELEQQVEAKAREFMDAGVQRLVDRMADHLCNPALVQEYGAWRLHGLDVLLHTDSRRLAAEVEKLDPDALVATGAALVRGIANRPELPGQLEHILRAAMDATEGRNIRSLLGGVEVHGIHMVRDLLIQRARALVETEAFARWWAEVVEGR